MEDLSAVEHADIVIIGGGILGCAIGYYLSRFKAGRVLLIERRLIAEANTSRAAALLTRARSKPCLMPLVRETYRALEDLEAQLGEALGLRRVGSLHVAASSQTKRDLIELVDLASQARIETHWLWAEDVMALAPWLNVPDDTLAAFMPEDGFIDPYVLAHAFARAAKMQGVTLWQNTSVTAIQRAGDQITGVGTDRGFVTSSLVIDAAGAWAGLLAGQIGCGLPMAPVRSHYWITAPNDLFSREQPIVILPDAKAYSRPEGSGLLFGLREAQSLSVDPQTLPDDLTDLVMSTDRKGWGCLIEGAPAMLPFFPALERIEIAHYVAGLSTYTPDSLFVLGGLPGLKGFLAATGCSGAGLAASGGIGLALAELATDRPCSFDLTPFQIDRFGPIEPMSEAFRQRCAKARSMKTSG